MADIDNFKKVNDLFGHRIGDEILKMFARVLLDNARSGDIVARYGGEEFTIILPATRVEYARELTERMRSQLEAKELAISASGKSSAASRRPSASPSSEPTTTPMPCYIAPTPNFTKPSARAGTALPPTKPSLPERLA